MSTPPRPAATVVVARARESGDPFEVFLVKRHGRAGFMAGAHVFPGGRVDEADVAFAARLCEGAQGRRLPPVDAPLSLLEAVAFSVAAIRETAEECGLLLARDASGAVPSAQVADAVFDALHADVPFEAALLERGLVPALDALVPLAWWITPVAEPKRFDTRFFLAEAPRGQRAHADLKETTEGAWLSPQAALAAYARSDLQLAPPTLATLEDLATCSDLGATHTLPLHPLRPVCPTLVEHGGALVLALPGDALHDEPEPAQRASRTRIVLGPDGRFRSEAAPRLATGAS